MVQSHSFFGKCRSNLGTASGRHAGDQWRQLGWARSREELRAMRDLSAFSAAGFDRGAPRWKEAIWLAAKWFFFQTSVPWPSAVRVALLRIFGASVGRGVVIRANVNVSFPWRLSIGDHVWLGEEVMILSLAPVKIGAHVCVSQRAFLCTGSHDHKKTTFDLVIRSITLGNGCWVAAQSFIGPGVEIGSGSVVSAGSVVMSSIPEHVLVRGNPAQVVKFLDAADEKAASGESANVPKRQG